MVRQSLWLIEEPNLLRKLKLLKKDLTPVKTYYGLCRIIKSLPGHMNVAGAITIILIEPVLVCIAKLLMVLSSNFKLTLIVIKILKSLNYEKRIAW